MRVSAISSLIALQLIMTACHIRGGEPSQSELLTALQDNIEHANERGGIKINLGNAGAFQNIQFDLKVHSLTKQGCSGADYAYTCDVAIMLSYPPIKDEPEMIISKMMVFDGPDGWRLVE
jgi:hypothetical protein